MIDLDNHEVVNFYREGQLFLARVFDKLEEKNVDFSNYHVDHICYRVNTFRKYEGKKIWLSKFAKYLGSSVVERRPISIFKLRTPIIYAHQSVEYIELPAPKLNNKYADGFEHIEFVIDKPFQYYLQKFPQLKFIKAATQKKINPELKIELGPQMSIKLHHRPINEVLEFETFIDRAII